MTWTLYDYRDHRGDNPVKKWCGQLQKPDLARMNKKIDLLESSGMDLCPGLVGPLRGSAHLYKIKINGSVAARLLLCKGPVNKEIEYTLLLGAFERDDELPEGTLETAEGYRQDIIRDPAKWRGLHERAKR
jgi:hypothetical protein